MQEEFIFKASPTVLERSPTNTSAFQDQLRVAIIRQLTYDEETRLYLKIFWTARVIRLLILCFNPEEMKADAFESCISGYGRDIQKALTKIVTYGFAFLGAARVQKTRKMFVEIGLAMDAIAAIADDSTKANAMIIKADAWRKMEELLEGEPAEETDA